MDEARCDAVSRIVASRRTLLGGIAAGLVIAANPLAPESPARKKKK